MDLLAFQKKEIDDAALVPGEDDQLKKEQNRLKNAEALYQTIASVANTLYTGDGAVAETLGEIRRQLESAARLDDTLDAACTEFSDAAFRLEDIGRELGAYLDQLAFDDGRAFEIDARLDVINRLKRQIRRHPDAVFQHAQTIDAQLKNQTPWTKRSRTQKQNWPGSTKHWCILPENCPQSAGSWRRCFQKTSNPSSAPSKCRVPDLTSCLRKPPPPRKPPPI
ncbi:MAG: hypothetical protein R2874_10415 [Desulfobacterales bacterium]